MSGMSTNSPIVAAARALRGAGYLHGIQFPQRPEGMRRLAAAARRRSQWRLAAGMEKLAECIEWMRPALDGEPGSPSRVAAARRAYDLGQDAVAIFTEAA